MANDASPPPPEPSPPPPSVVPFQPRPISGRIARMEVDVYLSGRIEIDVVRAPIDLEPAAGQVVIPCQDGVTIVLTRLGPCRSVPEGSCRGDCRTPARPAHGD